MRIAAIQMASGLDRDHNVASAQALVERAVADGARFVVLPETFNVLGDPEAMREAAEPLDGPTLTWARDLARRLGIGLLAGSILERVGEQHRAFNTSCLIGPDGAIAATYRKVHLFDCDVPGAALRESVVMQPGSTLEVGEAIGLPIGLTICYDLRFPEVFRILTLRGALLIAVPSAFTDRTGRDHWEVLLRARAIENQVTIIAANQAGGTGTGPRWHGRSMIVDPWGLVRAQAADGPAVVVADIDLERQAAIRRQLPCLANRRPEAYRWPAEG